MMNCPKTTIKMMDISIKKNDAFRVLQAITRDVIVNLEKYIIFKLKDERMMTGDPEDCGFSIDDIATSNGMTIDETIDVLFPNIIDRDEIRELLKFIVFVGDATEHPCPECGCELEFEREFDGSWMDIKCSNTACDFADSTEPDWDIQPGGHSFDN